METLQAAWEFLVDQVWPYWPGLMFIVVISIVAQTLKVRVLTKSIARKVKTVFWLRRVFPMLILAMGAITGALWVGEACPGIVTRTHKIWFFMGCSGIAILGFNAAKQWVKRKYDVDIGIEETTSVIPEEPKEEPEEEEEPGESMGLD